MGYILYPFLVRSNFLKKCQRVTQVVGCQVQLVLLILVFLEVYYSHFQKVALLHARHNSDPFSKFSFLDGKYKVDLDAAAV